MKSKPIRLIVDVISSKRTKGGQRRHFAIFTPTESPDKAFFCVFSDESHPRTLATTTGLTYRDVHFIGRTLGASKWEDERLGIPKKTFRDTHDILTELFNK